MNNDFRYALRFAGKSTWIALAFLAVTIWIAHFLRSISFGLYEDDYAVISYMWRLPDFLENTRSAVMDLPQGKPIGALMIGIFSFVGHKLGGLQAIYLMGFAIVTLNAFLLFILLRIVSTELVAITAALAFGLFPADTTHSFLTHSLGLQPSLTFFFLAAILYLSGRRVWSWVAITGTLLTYETPAPVFLAVPLFAFPWDRTLVRRLLAHAAIFAAIVLVVVGIRVAFGEERIAAMRGDIPGTLALIAKSVVIGPVVSMVQFVIAPLRAIANLNTTVIAFMLGSLPIFAWMLRRSATAAPAEGGGQSVVALQEDRAREGLQAIGRQLELWQLFLAGLAMLGLAYGLSFTHFPPVASYGRGTSVHLAAALGGSLIFAVICTLIIAGARRFGLQFLAVLLISLYLSLVLAYRLLIQDDFVRAWQNQRSFWTSAIAAIPDMTENTVIFVLARNLPGTAFILSNSWADPIILGQLFEFPKHWANPPRLFVVNKSWPKALVREGDRFRWMVPEATWFAHWETFPNSNVILLEMDNGKLARRFGSTNIHGLDLNLKMVPADAKLKFEKGPLYSYLIGDAR